MARPYIELYINNRKVEFTEPPQILLTYSHNEVHNPTIVKNSYSKTITIDGTPNNNKIFNCFADMRWVNGAGFNPSRKETFTLFHNGEPIETGYVKLDNVKKMGNRVQYQITLFGGLGQFLYNLSYGEDGEQRKLRDLDYAIELGEFVINKGVVTDAWRQINGLSYIDNIYDFINFAPCYNGIPKDFTANKVAIDVESFRLNNPRLYNQFTVSKDGFSTVNGWMTGEFTQDYDEWQTKDLRSYLQRPVIRLKEIINACCNPDNNGGYEVELDEEFFNDNNPYWDKAWVTLPLLTEIEEIKSEEEITTTDNGEKITLDGLVQGDIFTITVPYFVVSNADVTVQPNGYGSRLLTGAYTFDRDTPLIAANMAIYTQLVAYDADGNKIGGSVINSMYSKTTRANNFTYSPEYEAPINEIIGGFYNISGYDYKYRFFDDYEIGGYVGGTLPYSKLVIENIKYEEGMYFKLVTKIATVDNGTVKGYAGKLFWYEGYDAYPVDPVLSYKWGESVANKTKFGWYVTKNTLLNSEHTPADYFLSYIKLFNLHIWKDMYENKIYVYKRQNFFTNEKYDIENLIDRSQTIDIKPITFDAKWYNYKYDMETNGVLYKDYNNEYGIPYGIQKIDTNYNFDNSSKDLLESNVYKGCIMQRGKSRYYVDIYQAFSDDDVYYPPYALDGIQTYLYNASGDTTEGSYITPKTTEQSFNWWTEKYFDIMPKPSFVDDKNEIIDGSNVLLFYNGKAELKDVSGKRLDFTLTDDVVEFETLNEGEPCWIWSMNWDIAYPVYYLPNFNRYITNENSWITHSWDFGTPKTLYIPDYNIDDSSNLYTQYWQSYIRDMYSVDTRVVECMVLLKERVIGDWLRRFYYFDGSYWVMNEITDYDVTGNEPTKCTLIRINDTSNYL